MGGEEYAFMTMRRPNRIIFVSNGVAVQGGQLHHLRNPQYDFDDAVIAIGVQRRSKRLARKERFWDEITGAGKSFSQSALLCGRDWHSLSP